jgi:hypothetical protein
VKVDVNGGAQRTGYVDVTAQNGTPASVQLTLPQDPGQFILSVTPATTALQFGGDGGDQNITVRNAGAGSMTWSVALAPAADFVTLTPPSPIPQLGANEQVDVKIHLAPNTTATARQAHVQVTAGAQSKTVDISQDPCASPAAPQSVNASDGTRPDEVLVSWTAVTGATGYHVFRSDSNNSATAQFLANVDANTVTYGDTGAQPATTVNVSTGCFGQQTQPKYTYYYYWVKTVNSCGEGEFSASDQGYRGLPGTKDALRTTYAKVLPGATSDQTPLPIEADSSLFIRVRSDAGVDPQTVWGVVRSATVNSSVVEWWPIDAANSTDGWVVYRNHAPWQAGEQVSFSAGASAASGEMLAPITYTFEVQESNAALVQPMWQPGPGDYDATQLDPSQQGNQWVRVYSIPIASTPGTGAFVGDTFQIGPDQVFEKPQRVWLPVPTGLDPGNLQLKYYSGESAGWYPADSVEGWLVPDSYLQVEINGTQYLGFLVNHGGMAGLAPRPEATVQQQANVTAFLTPHKSGDLLVLFGTLAGLLASGRLRRRAGRLIG